MSARLEPILVPAAAIAVSLVLFGGFVAASGADPIAVYRQMVRGAFGTWFSFETSLTRAAPLMLTALCTAIPARVGLVVIGGEGALVLGGLAAAVTATSLTGASPLLVTAAMLLAGFLAGGAWIALCTGLRAYRGVNETISSLLLTYLALAIFQQLVEGPLRDPGSLNKPSTSPIGDAAALANVPGLDVHWGLGFGVIACVLAYLVLDRSTLGFSFRIAGGNVRAARLAGLPVARLVTIAGVLGGGCAGIAGMAEVAAVHGTANASLIAGYGTSGILVAFLARHHPLAIVPVAMLLGGIAASGGLLQRSVGLPDAAVHVLQGILFVTILASETLRGRLSERAPGRTPPPPALGLTKEVA